MKSTQDSRSDIKLNAEHYTQHSATQYGLAHEWIDAFPLQGNEQILDVGCGDGRITAELAHLVPKGAVLGIDSSPAMITHAKHQFQISNLSFQQIRAEEFESIKQFDLILCVNVLHWLRNPEKAVAKMVAHLAPKGTLYLLTYPQESPYWTFLSETLSHFKLPDTTRFLSTEKYTHLLQESGLQVSCQIEERTAHYTTEKDLINYIKGWLPCYVTLPSEFEHLFLLEAARRGRLHSTSTSSIELPYSKLTLECRKE